MKQKTVVLGVMGLSDPHIVANKFLDHTLQKAGCFKIVNLGSQCAPDEFIKAAIEVKADAILIGSLCGYGEVDAQGFRQKCIEAGLGDILLYIGGNLVPGREDPGEVEQRLKNIGFDRVYHQATDLNKVVDTLKADLKIG